jgi:hypothetical protein
MPERSAMRITHFFFLVMLLLYIVPYLLVILMPRWYLAIAAAALPGAVVWQRLQAVEAYVRTHPDPDWATFDIGFYQIILATLAVALAVRLVAAVLSGVGFTIWVIVPLHIAGFLAMPTYLALPLLLQEWQRRSPPQVCLRTSFEIGIAGTRFRIPAAPFFSVHLGSDPTKENYFFSYAPSFRGLCAKTDNGRRPLRATNMVIWFQRTKCTAEPAWARAACADFASKYGYRRHDPEWPIKANIFNPAEIRGSGGFGATLSTYDDRSVPPSSREYFFVSPTIKTPDGKPLAARCSGLGNGIELCQTAYPWRDGAHILFEFLAPRDAIDAAVQRVDARLRALLDDLTIPSGG